LTVSLVGIDTRPRNLDYQVARGYKLLGLSSSQIGPSKKETLAIGNTAAPTQRGFVNSPQIETADEIGE
jgi:hypothetical protein